MQTKPVRALGGDITQATLQQTLSNLNIDSQVSQLSYVEKRLLIIISLTQQLSGVTNDWGRTLESPSNQIRIMNEQWQRLQRNVGNLFMGMIGKVLPYLNAILMVLTEIVSAVARLLGFKIDDFDFFDESAVSGIEDFGDGLDSATDSAKKLKQSLRGFDKLNVITTPTDSTGGAGSGVGGINPKLMEAFNSAFDEYNKKLTEVEMKATKIRDKIMEWLGFEKHVDEETGEVTFKFKKITSGTILGALAVGGAIYNGVKTIFKFLEKIGLLKFTGIKDLIKFFGGGKLTGGITKLASSLGMSVGTLGLVVAAIVAIGAALVYAYTHSDVFKEKVDTMVSSVSILIKDLYDIITKGLEKAWEIIEPIWNDIKTIIVEVVQYCYENVVYNFTQIVDFITGVAKIIDDLIHGDFSGAFEDFKTMVGDLWDNWKEHFEKMVDKVIEIVPKIVEKMSEILTWLGELPEKAGEKIGEFTGKIINKIFETDWIAEGKKLIENICKGIKDIKTNLNDFGIRLYHKIKESLSTVNWWELGKDVMKAIINGISWDSQLKAKFTNGFLNGIKEALKIHSPSRLIEDEKIGDNVFRGITFGMERQLPTLKEQAESIVDTLNSGIKEATIDSNFNYDIPQFNPNSININANNTSASSNNSRTSFNPTFIIQVGNKELAKQVITDLQDMAIDNGKPITIGG